MKKTILVIDDSIDVRKLFKFHLENNGYNVIVTENGEEGLAKIKEVEIDLVILDLLLPGISGEEVCREIKRNKNLIKIPIIMITAQDSDLKKIIGMVIGADCFITKPLDMKKILSEIDKLI